MTQHNTLNVKFSNSQFSKLKLGIKSGNIGHYYTDNIMQRSERYH